MNIVLDLLDRLKIVLLKGRINSLNVFEPMEVCSHLLPCVEHLSCCSLGFENRAYHHAYMCLKH